MHKYLVCVANKIDNLKTCLKITSKNCFIIWYSVYYTENIIYDYII